MIGLIRNVCVVAAGSIVVFGYWYLEEAMQIPGVLVAIVHLLVIPILSAAMGVFVLKGGLVYRGMLTASIIPIATILFIFGTSGQMDPEGRGLLVYYVAVEVVTVCIAFGVIELVARAYRWEKAYKESKSYKESSV